MIFLPFSLVSGVPPEMRHLLRRIQERKLVVEEKTPLMLFELLAPFQYQEACETQVPSPNPKLTSLMWLSPLFRHLMMTHLSGSFFKSLYS